MKHGQYPLLSRRIASHRLTRAITLLCCAGRHLFPKSWAPESRSTVHDSTNFALAVWLSKTNWTATLLALCARVIGLGTTLSGTARMASNRVVMLTQMHSQVSPTLPDQELEVVRRMWESGPLRQFSDTQAKSHYVAYSGPFLTGYAGSYVCDRCGRSFAGAYRVSSTQEWLCPNCSRGKLRQQPDQEGRS